MSYGERNARDHVRSPTTSQGRLSTLRDGLLVRFPDMPDGWEYLGLVHEKRDEHHAAAGCYRRALELVRRHPEDHEPDFEQQFEDLIARLDPKATA